MNYKIAKTMLVLCIVYLIGFYILKFIFPELLIQVITSETIIKFSNFINIWKGFEYILTAITLFITFYLFACAGSGKFKFGIVKTAIMILFVVIETLICDFLPELYTHTSICLMLIISLICKGNFSYTVISFTIHGYLSQFLMSIRGFETVIVQVAEIGVLAGIVLTLEMYVWLILLALLFYFKEKKNEQVCASVS